MNGYASNPTNSDDGASSSLTAGLLARKGRALPAVDADAHAGVDLDMQPARPVIAAVTKGVSQETIESLYPAVPENSDVEPRSNVHRFRQLAAPDIIPPDEVAPESPAMASRVPNNSHIELKPRPSRRPIQERRGPKANVTFRMPARDFIRLRFAARDLEMSCQSVILEALDCYLDANDVEAVSDEVCVSETERLMQTMIKRKGG